jgi:hypothetical protein
MTQPLGQNQITKSQPAKPKIERIKAITLASLVPTGTDLPKASSTTTPPNFQANGLAHANLDKKIQAIA